MPVPMFPNQKTKWILVALLILLIVLYLMSGTARHANAYGGGPHHREHTLSFCPTNSDIYLIDSTMNAWRYDFPNKYKLHVLSLSRIKYQPSHSLIWRAWKTKSTQRKVRLLYFARQEAVKCH